MRRAGRRTPAPQLRLQGPLSIGLGVVGGVFTLVVIDEFFWGWGVGLVVGVLAGPAIARRRPDLAVVPPGEPVGGWQVVLVGALAVAAVVTVVLALTN